MRRQKKAPQCGAFLLRPKITWQQKRQQQRPEQQRKRQQREQQPEPEQQRELQQREPEQQLLLSCRKQPGQQQRSGRPERGTCSFYLPKSSELKQFPEIARTQGPD
jgi:hypothetical protein